MTSIILLMALAARAAGTSADIELVRPTFAEGSMPGMDSPVIDDRGTVRAGVFLQYQRDPLILYTRDVEEGAVVANRVPLLLGLSWDLNRVASARISVPAAVQWGTDIPDLARDGPVMGDIWAGMRLRLVNQRKWDLGVRGDLGLPTATRDAWMGEVAPRGIIGPTALIDVGPIDLLVDANMTIRQQIVTGSDFTLGSEAVVGLGARYEIWEDRAYIGASFLQRTGLGFTALGGAENPSELLSVVQLRPWRTAQFDIGAGKGIAEGYGTSEFRAYAGYTFIRVKPPPEPQPELVINTVPETIPDTPLVIPPDPPKEPEWGEEELARVQGELIVIRDPIQFEFNTEKILPESLPTLRYVASLMNDNWQIGHVVVEGHASEEGTYVYNYDLSIRRARSVWEELLKAGVHPDRISYRGMGETVPRTPGADEASLAYNRRVEFRIIKQFAQGEKPPVYRTDVRLPWSGEGAAVVEPKAPPPPEPKPKREPKPDDPLNLDIFLNEDDSGDASGKSEEPKPEEKKPAGGDKKEAP